MNRLLNHAPAVASHVVLYALMFALPLVGWGMLSAARYPIVDYGPLELPPILPRDAALYAALRTAHMVLAFLLFAAFLAHFAAALMHALIYRDGIFPSMVSWKARAGNLAAATENEVRPARTLEGYHHRRRAQAHRRPRA